MAKETYVQLCPICGSKNISFFKGNKTSEIAAVNMYQCDRCKNIFSFPLEVPKSNAGKIKEVKLTKAIIRDTPNSAYTSLGEFEVHIYWKILGAAMLLIGLFYAVSATIPVLCYLQEGITQCEANTNPFGFLFTGTAMALAGMYFLFESIQRRGKTSEKTKMVTRLGLVIALLIVAIFLGTGHLYIFQWG